MSEQGSGRGETFANTPPGRYFLDIITGGGTDYTIRIEECGESGEARPEEGTKGEPKEQPKTTPPPPPRPTPPPPPRPTPPAPAPPFKSGGAEAGPVPLMKSGECPVEFPIKQGEACYATP